MIRVHPSLRHRFTPLARLASLPLLGALVLGPGCKTETPEQAKPTPELDAVERGPVAEAPTPPPTGARVHTIDSAPIADHGGVIATLQLPSGTAMTDIAAVLDSVQPGASMMLTLQLPKLLEEAVGFKLGDAKLNAPISLVVANPRAHGQPVAMLVEASNPAALREQATAAGYEVRERDGRLLIGPAPIVAATEDFAFTHLTGYPDHSEFIVYPGMLLKIFAEDIAEGLDSMSAMMAGLGTTSEGSVALLRSYVKGMIAVGHQTERVVFSISSAAGSADLNVRLYPTEASVFASFVAAQVPADHALLSKLPSTAQAGMMVMSGDLRAGDARAALIDFSIEFMGSIYSSLSSEEWAALMNPWLDNIDGRFAATTAMNIGADPAAIGMDLNAVMGAVDSEALRSAWRAMLGQMAKQSGFEMMGMKIEVRYEQDALEHDGVSIDHYATTLDASTLPANERAAMEAAGSTNQQLHLAIFDGVAAIATADEAGRSIGAMIDASRGKAEGLQPAADLAAALSTAMHRGDSAIMYFDLNNIADAGAQVPFRAFTFNVGKSGPALDVRISIRK